MAQETRTRYRDALVHAQFRALFVSQLATVAGTSVAAVALTVLVYERTASPLLSSLTFALGFVPYLLGGGVLSAVVDRVPPRRLVTRCSLGAALVAAAMAWPGAPVWLLLVLLVGIGTLTSLAAGAQAALVRAVVPDDAYVPARSLLRIVAQLAQIVGNAAGGALLVVLTPSGAILTNALSFAVAALVIRLGVSDAPVTGRPAGSAVLRDSLAGARTVLAHAELRRLLLLTWLVPAFSVAPEALAAPYVAGLGGRGWLVGVWLTALPIGMVAGDLAGVWRLTTERQRLVVAPAAAISFVPYLAFSTTPPIMLALPLLALSGAGALYSLGLDLRVRDASPDHLFARVMTLSSAGMMTCQGLGFVLAGAAAQVMGPSAAIAAAGACGIAAAVAFGPWSRRRRYASEAVVSSRDAP
ncbi:MAG: MFS transporter [Gaiellaceae bacterium]